MGESYVRNGEGIGAAKSLASPSKPTFTLRPNPAQGNLVLDIIKNAIDLPQILRIYDLHGSLVLQTNIQTTQTLMDVAPLPADIYFVRIQDESHKLVLIK